ncbi:MAG: hypothetical protein FWG15_07730 [Propionibacteriaceae bacterium]|nr:hypothetical protein [Propionibacteriaceae bacterium]
MFCYKCAQEIDNEAVVCIHCGVATKNHGNAKDTPIIINNSASSSASAAASAGGLVPRKYNLALDIVLIICTGGLWLIWMLVRPKYY